MSINPTELFEQAEKARAYIAITAKHGPSQQLIDFINYDGRLFEDLGLESISHMNFSTQVQHELLLNSLDPDQMDQLATEGLNKFIEDLSTTLKYAGLGMGYGGYFFALKKISNFRDPGALRDALKAVKLQYAGLAMALAGVAIKIINDKRNSNTISYSAFDRGVKAIKSSLSAIKNIVNDLPSTGDYDKWDKFYDRVTGYDEDLSDSLSKISDIAHESNVVFEDSGWTAENFTSTAKSFDALTKELGDVFKALGTKLEASNKLEVEDTKSRKIMNSSIGEIKSMVLLIENAVSQLAKVLGKVSHHFEKK